jgi:hypothetical protein
MKRYFCTYFDRNYLVKGLALIDSLRQHHANNFEIIVVCMDELTRVLLDKLNLENVKTFPIHEIEYKDEALLNCRTNRSATEYLWTCTPSIILRLLEKFNNIDILTYLDADLFFYSSSDVIFSELGSKSVLIHPHRFPPELKAQEKHGIYNVGLLCFRNNEEALNVLKWWRERCLEWCYARVEDGKFGDQGYLNDWPQRFPCVQVSLNDGVGVAPWNDDQYSFSKNNLNQPCVSGTPIVFYHYHSFVIMNAALLVPASDPVYTPSIDLVRLCVLPYAYSLVSQISTIQKIQADFDFGINKLDFGLSGAHGFLCLKAVAQEIAKINAPQKTIDIDSHWNWYEPGR